MDTNFLMIPGQFKVDIFSELKRLINEPFDVYIHESTVGELEKFSKGNTKAKLHANVALKLIKQKNLKRLANSVNEKYTDDLILEGVTSKDIVCTQDQVLKRRLKAFHKGIRLITLKSKKYLNFE